MRILQSLASGLIAVAGVALVVPAAWLRSAIRSLIDVMTFEG